MVDQYHLYLSSVVIVSSTNFEFQSPSTFQMLGLGALALSMSKYSPHT